MKSKCTVKKLKSKVQSQDLCMKYLIKLLIPPVLLILWNKLFPKKEDDKREILSQSVSHVDYLVEVFQKLNESQLSDPNFMENFIIREVGLNNELLTEQPEELKEYYGKGLYVWQNPMQFSKFLVWLFHNGRNYKSYIEVGCRWGGTFIVISELLRKINPDFQTATAADLIDKSPFIERYQLITNDNPNFKVQYFQGSSTSTEFKNFYNELKPDIAFVDGDHSLKGALKDHLLVRSHAKIIVHHDVYSDSCADTTMLWQSLKELESTKENVEFIDQHDSVAGKYLGIGVLYN